MDWSIILSSCIVAGTTIVSIFIKELVQSNKNKKQACVVRYTKQNENVQKAIDFTLNETLADRAYVFEFHNGDSFYSGNHQQKFSCTYESLNAGVSSESMRLQDLRVSTFNSFIKDVLGIHGEKLFRLEDIESIDSPLLRNWLEERGIRSCYAFPIETLNHGVVGIICIDYTKKKTEIYKKDIDLIRNQAKIISGYLI